MFQPPVATSPIVTDLPVGDEPLFLRKLSSRVALPQLERAALLKVLGANVRNLAPRMPIIEAGSAPAELSVMLDGWAYRYADCGDGRRQIVSVYLPGDICDPDVFLTGHADQTIASVGRARIAAIGRSTFAILAQRCPTISMGIAWESATLAARQRQWTINVARKSADQRIAYLLCELALRLETVGLGSRTGFAIPLSQAELGLACALTPEHTNRTLRRLRESGIASIGQGIVRIDGFSRLEEMIGPKDPVPQENHSAGLR